MSNDYTPEHAAEKKTFPLFTNKTYDQLKWIAQIFLPAVGTLYFALAAIWGLPKAEEVVGTVTAIDAFLGAVLLFAHKAYVNSGQRFDGEMVVQSTTTDEGEEAKTLRLALDVDPFELDKQSEVVFKVKSE